MYDLPQRVRQHQTETKALAIFLYHLRDFGGIVRDLRESDYGLDLEYEFVIDHRVTGRFVKIQLKGIEGIKGKHPRIRNLKQSTLNYWAQVSFRVNTIVVGVDVITERIYFTFPVFWDAISMIDNTRKRKSIAFVDLGRSSKTVKVADLNQAVAILIHHTALIPSINEILLAQKSVLARLEDILEFCSECIYHDQFLEFEEWDELKRLLDDARVLLWRANIKDELDGCDTNCSWHSLDFFRQNTRDGTVRNWDMRDKLNVIVVALLEELAALRKKAISALYYWLMQDRDYLELVYKHNVAKLASKTIEGVIKKYRSIGTAYIEKDFGRFVSARIAELRGGSSSTAK